MYPKCSHPKTSLCYALRGMRAGWNESIDGFYVWHENQPNKALCTFDHESLWKTLCDRVQVVVKVGAGMDARASSLSMSSIRFN